MNSRKSQKSYDNAALLMEWEGQYFAILFNAEMNAKKK